MVLFCGHSATKDWARDRTVLRNGGILKTGLLHSLGISGALAQG